MREIGQIQRSERTVEQPECDQEERGTDEIEHHVTDSGAGSGEPAAMGQQRVGSEQHHFEEDEQVEQVAGQEGAGQAHQLQLEQRVEVPSACVETAAGVEQCGESEDSGEERHSGRQPIDDEDDAERGRPVAEGVDAQQSVVGEQRQPCREHYQQAAGQ